MTHPRKRAGGVDIHQKIIPRRRAGSAIRQKDARQIDGLTDGRTHKTDGPIDMQRTERRAHARTDGQRLEGKRSKRIDGPKDNRIDEDWMDQMGEAEPERRKERISCSIV